MDSWSGGARNRPLRPWKPALDAASKSPKTIISYPDCVKRLEEYLAAHELPMEPPSIRGFLAAGRDRAQATGAAGRAGPGS